MIPSRSLIYLSDPTWFAGIAILAVPTKAHTYRKKNLSGIELGYARSNATLIPWNASRQFRGMGTNRGRFAGTRALKDCCEALLA